jgi:FkbM family methyltransferase
MRTFIKNLFFFFLVVGCIGGPWVAQGAPPPLEITISHAARLALLKKKGFQPKVIYDIGAYRGAWSQEIEKVFSASQFFLFEANEENRPFLQKLPFSYFCTALSDQEGVATLYANNSSGDSLFKEQTRFYAQGKYVEKQVRVSTLEGVVSKHHLPLPDLIKMDVQGAEQLIIQGSPAIFRHAEVVIVETKVLEYNKSAPLIFEMMALMNKMGYRILDILELHYLPTQELNEIDLLFVKQDSSLIKKGVLW